MGYAGLMRILVISMTCAAALITGVIGVGLAIETSVISPPALNVRVDSVTLVSLHRCMSRRAMKIDAIVSNLVICDRYRELTALRAEA